MKYIALIRGINVGGNNKVPMGELKTCFENVGFENVSTYINSGNIIFESSIKDTAELVGMCEVILESEFGVQTVVAVISADELHAAAKNVPDWWDKDDKSRHNAIFVIAPADPEATLRAAGEIKPEYEKVGRYGHVIFWSAAIETIGRTRYARIVGTPAYKDMTIRNSNTFRKLVELTA